MSVVEYVHGRGYVYGTNLGSEHWWGFNVEGLFPFATYEIHSLASHDYSCFVAGDVPDGTIFTIGEYDGGIGNAYLCKFSICEAASGEKNEERAMYGNGFIEGNYRVVARADAPIKATRLFDWWEKGGVEQTLAYAEHCAAHIEKRGLKHLPPMGAIEEVKIVPVRLTVAQYDRLKAIADTSNLSIGEIIEQAVDKSCRELFES